MTIEYEITLDDFRSAFQLHRRKYQKGWIVFNICMSVLCIILIPFWITSVIDGGLAAALNIMRSNGVLFFCLGYLYIFVPLYRNRSYSKVYAGQFPEKKLRLEFKDEFIEADALQNSETKFYWNSIVKVCENKKMVLVYVAKLKFLIIPKRILTESTLAELKDILRRNVPAGVVVP